MPEQAEPEEATATPPRPGAATEPWTVELRRFAVKNARVLLSLGLLIAGVVLVILGWYGSAHSDQIYAQIPYLISGGLLGLGLIIVSGILAAGALQERSVDALRSEIARAVADAVTSSAKYEPQREHAASTNGRKVYVLKGGRSFHEAGCPLLEGKENAKELVPARAAAEGFAACKLCGPD